MLRSILINGKFVAAKSNTAIKIHNPATLEKLDKTRHRAQGLLQVMRRDIGKLRELLV